MSTVGPFAEIRVVVYLPPALTGESDTAIYQQVRLVPVERVNMRDVPNGLPAVVARSVKYIERELMS